MFFLDTNVLIYGFDATAGQKYTIAAALIHRALEEGAGCISTQVVQECTHVLLKKIFPQNGADAVRHLYHSTLFPLCRFHITTPALYEKALNLKERYQFSFYDSLIVAAAVLLGCDTLYTEDLQDGQVIEGVRIVNPFLN
jgi:predicted nucleic acid-binding protein